MAVIGIEKITPIIPKSAPNIKIDRITAKGWSPSLSPISLGVKKLDSNSWPKTNTISI